jgi:triosephosphate isomerase
MPTRKKFVAGNWKMNTTLDGAKALARAVAAGLGEAPAVTVAVCPPFPWLLAVAEAVKGTRVGLGAQDCHFEKDGAFTGSVSPLMLVEAGCHYAIIGHSERRHGLGETDALLNKKVNAALIAGLRVIFCVGELLAEREAGKTEAVLERQLTAGLAGVQPAQMANLVIAYEPVWAIGGPKPATPDQAQAAHASIRGKIAELYGENVAGSLLIQYGGAVKPDNAAGLLHLPDVDGALVGGASLKSDSFLAIVKAAGS